MPIAGWYPDPAGRPGAFRFWDGASWTADLTDNPYAAPPGGDGQSRPSGPGPSPVPAPTNPFESSSGPTGFQSCETGPAQQTRAPQPPQQHPQHPQQRGTSSTGRTLGLLLLAVLATLLVGVITFFIVRGATDDSTDARAGAPSPSAVAAGVQTADPAEG
ncbi:MAG: hypothetical protein JWN84_2370 [Nocardioides sp.]|nr:hypothetical protein [Nocardioides sp.]